MLDPSPTLVYIAISFDTAYQQHLETRTYFFPVHCRRISLDLAAFNASGSRQIQSPAARLDMRPKLKTICMSITICQIDGFVVESIIRL